jgi:hypothetical protein
MALSDSRRSRRPKSASRPLPSPRRVSPVASDHLPDVLCPLPRRIERVRLSLLPHSCCLPRCTGGSASATSLSRPAQASLALRPVELLSHPRWPSSRGFDPAGYPPKPLVSYQTYRQLSGWLLPPLVIRAFSGHTVHPGFCRGVWHSGEGCGGHVQPPRAICAPPPAAP